MILTDEEIWQIGMQDISLDAPYGYARAIESAVLAKLKAQEPVGVFADVNRLIPNAKARWEQMVDEAYDGKEYVHLYLHPLPPNDVVRDPRVTELEAVLRECREAMQKAKYSGTPYTSSYNRAIAKIDEVLK